MGEVTNNALPHPFSRLACEPRLAAQMGQAPGHGSQASRLNGLLALVLLLGCSVAVNAARAAQPAAPAIPVAPMDRTTPVDFEAEVLPLLRDSCLACHNRTRAKADLILETPADILKGGENGPAVVPGNSKASLLLQSAAHQAETPMPPKDNKV